MRAIGIVCFRFVTLVIFFVLITRSEVVAARVLGSLELSSTAFSNLSLNLGTHTSSTVPVEMPLPNFYCLMLEHFTG